MTITKIRRARTGVPDKIGEDVRERKEIGGGRERKKKKSRGRAKKEGNQKRIDGVGCVWQFRNLPHGCHIHIS